MTIKTKYDDTRKRLILYRNGFPFQTFTVTVDTAYEQIPLLLEAFKYDK